MATDYTFAALQSALAVIEAGTGTAEVKRALANTLIAAYYAAN